MKPIFLKLGGSLITDKDLPFTARVDVIREVSGQIKAALAKNPGLRLLLGHGSGSFGHAAAEAAGYPRWKGNSFDSRGFQAIQKAARDLNRLVVEEFNRIGLPALSFPPSASIQSSDKKIIEWNVQPIQKALNQGLLPVIYGDAVLDDQLGGVIYSTEELFLYLINHLHPDKVLIAGKEAGVWEDFPKRRRLIAVLTEENFRKFETSINTSQSVDVTGGMLRKALLLLQMRKEHPETSFHIFSGNQPGAIFQSLTGLPPGTAIQ